MRLKGAHAVARAIPRGADLTGAALFIPDQHRTTSQTQVLALLQKGFPPSSKSTFRLIMRCASECRALIEPNPAVKKTFRETSNFLFGPNYTVQCILAWAGYFTRFSYGGLPSPPCRVSLCRGELACRSYNLSHTTCEICDTAGFSRNARCATTGSWCLHRKVAKYPAQADIFKNQALQIACGAGKFKRLLVRGVA